MSTFTVTETTLGTTATAIASGLAPGRYQIIVQAVDTGSSINIGDSSVTSGLGAGLTLDSSSGPSSRPLALDVVMGGNDALYAISDTSGKRVKVMVNPR